MALSAPNKSAVLTAFIFSPRCGADIRGCATSSPSPGNRRRLEYRRGRFLFNRHLVLVWNRFHQHGIALDKVAIQEPQRQGILDQPLHRPSHRTRTVLRIVALLNQETHRRWRELQPDSTVEQHLLHTTHL